MTLPTNPEAPPPVVTAAAKREAPTRPVAPLATSIPDDVMELAEEAYLHAIYMTTSDEPRNMVVMVARAIMAETERCITAVRNCRSLDENGYLCEKSEAIKAIRLPTIHSRTT